MSTAFVTVLKEAFPAFPGDESGGAGGLPIAHDRGLAVGGHSWGGYLALMALHHRSEQVVKNPPLISERGMGFNTLNKCYAKEFSTVFQCGVAL